MKCSKCGSRTNVIEVYNGKHHKTRRRECPSCGERFTTKEYAVEEFEGSARLKEKLEEANAQIAKLTKFHEAVLGSAFEFTK